VKAAEGDYILAVDGSPIDTSKDIYHAFIDTAGRTTLITLGKNPVIDEQAWDVVIKPIASEAGLRYRNWVENNRKMVEEQSKGQVGYIYVPNTGVDGQNELFRQFFGQRHLPALLIDDRWNGGGQIPTRFIELLNRPTVNYWARRNGNDWPWPPDAHFGHKAMLINGLAGSGGDAFPHYFKQEGLGKLFGTRTWGGLVGISGNPGLIDGGSISVPTFGFYNPNGQWGIEGHGVDPDVEVIDDPALMQNGNDPQLSAAVDHLLEQIRTKPIVTPKRPKSPDRSGMGIPQNER
jgi:tricorn protease